MDVKETLLQLLTGEKDVNELTKYEMMELYQNAEHDRLEKIGILDNCKEIYTLEKEKEKEMSEKLGHAMNLINEAINILSAYELSLRSTHYGVKFIDDSGNVVYSDGILTKSNRTRLSPGLATGYKKFCFPILKALIEMGGSARSTNVIENVGEQMKESLNKYDLELLPSNKLKRWEQSVNNAKHLLMEMKCIKSDSPVGVWEITEKGCNYHEDFMLNSYNPEDSLKNWSFENVGDDEK